MKKSELRKEFLAHRKALLPAEVERRSELIAGHFFNYFGSVHLANELAVIHTFLPIRRNNEVDTWPIITRFWTNFRHVAISVPIMDAGIRQLTHHTISSETVLIENELGIPEPVLQAKTKTDLQRVKAVLIPLLAFDWQGNRVGYGGGYYDQFLAGEVPHSRKIGLSLFEPVDSISDLEPTDVRLDACITPTQVYRFA